MRGSEVVVVVVGWRVGCAGVHWRMRRGVEAAGVCLCHRKQKGGVCMRGRVCMRGGVCMRGSTVDSCAQGWLARAPRLQRLLL